MADQNLDLNRETLLRILAQKIGCQPGDVDFLFGKNRDDDDPFTIPDIKDDPLNPVISRMIKD